MSANVQIALWGIASILPFVLNFSTRRHADAIGLSAMLGMTWVFGRVCGVVWTPPECMQFYPVEDALCGMVCVLTWQSHRAWWKMALAFLFLAQCTLHVTFWANWPGASNLRAYIALNNLGFALELLCAGVPGATYVAIRSLDWLHDRARAHHVAEP